MPSFDDDFAAFGWPALTTEFGLTVTYRRGEDSVDLVALPDRSEFEQTDDEGIVTTMRIRDYMVLASALVLGGEATTPQRGDKIEETVGGTTRTYQALPTPDGEIYRDEDPGHTIYRVHTKEISVA